jgi:hypothetical protein
VRFIVSEFDVLVVLVQFLTRNIFQLQLRVRARVTLRLRVSQSVSQSVSQYVLVSSPLCARLTRYCFLFKSFGLEFVVLSLCGALPDERPGLSFVNHSLVDSEGF